MELDVDTASFTPLVGVICLIIGYWYGVRTEKNHYCFKVTSFCNRQKRKIPGLRLDAYQIGYRAQLHVKGFPCLDPHLVIIEGSKEFECNPAEIRNIVREMVKVIIATKTGGIPYIIEELETYQCNKT